MVGRKETIELWPFSQSELVGRPSHFVDACFTGEPTTQAEGQTTGSERRVGYISRIVAGGFPEAINREDRRRIRFFSAYIEDLVDRDITQLGEIERREQLKRLLAAVAASAAQLFVADRFASSLGLAAKTVERYMSLFEEVFLVKRLPPWSNSATSGAVRTRTVVVVDSGLATWLNGRNRTRLERNDPVFGQLLENFVLSEIARTIPLSDVEPTLQHYRTRDGIEVDAVLAHLDGSIVGIEVKASDSVRSDDLTGLTHLRDKAGADFVGGFVLHPGTATRSLGDRLWAVPIDALWTW